MASFDAMMANPGTCKSKEKRENPKVRFGRYQLCKALQVGSTSEVYLAEDVYTEVCCK
jgi:ribosomal protein L7Ae-like RNA K-turn-binding protein